MFLEFVVLALTLMAFLAFKLHQSHQYWQRRGVPTPAYINFFFGNNPGMHVEQMTGRSSMSDLAKRQYNELYGCKFYGVYFLHMRALMICDPVILKEILVKEFSRFTDRTSAGTMKILTSGAKTDELWAKQLLNIPGEHWKGVRSTFSPIFTSGKLKAMVPFIQEVNNRLLNLFQEAYKNDHDINVTDAFGKFTMDTIASCAFGVDAQSFLSEENSPFVKNAKEIFRRNPMDVFKMMIAFMPGGMQIFRLFKIGVFKPREAKFFLDVLETTLKARMESKHRRNDLIDFMVDAVKEASEESGKDPLDEITVFANAIVILIAGYDTTAQTLSYCAYYLVKNPEIQQRLQEEIDESFEQSDGKMPSYDQIQSLEYLEMVFYETLRMHPPVPILNRACVKDYNIPGTDITIKAGDDLFINIAGIHHDPKYYPDPSTFDPERFNKENKAQRHPCAFLGFGQGPRNCIGMRFALLEAKLVLFNLLREFNFVKSPNTIDKIVVDPQSALSACKDPIFIKVEKRA